MGLELKLEISRFIQRQHSKKWNSKKMKILIFKGIIHSLSNLENTNIHIDISGNSRQLPNSAGNFTLFPKERGILPFSPKKGEFYPFPQRKGNFPLFPKERFYFNTLKPYYNNNIYTLICYNYNVSIAFYILKIKSYKADHAPKKYMIKLMKRRRE